MSKKTKNASTSVGEIDQRDRRSQNGKPEAATDRFLRIWREEEIARCEAKLRDLIQGFEYLHHVQPVPYGLVGRLAHQRDKMHRVERRLWHLRQARLL